MNGRMFGRLSGELILICNAQMQVCEANELTCATLGEPIVGQPLSQLFTSMARAKGAAFIAELQRLDASAVSATWELLLHVPHAAPLLAGLRGGRLPEGGWMILGSSELPHLTSLYHEVLSLNTELTNLIRDLTREQAALNETVHRLLEVQEKRHADPN